MDLGWISTDSMSAADEFREPTGVERAIFELLLDAPFVGRDEIREQLAQCLVRAIDEDGSVQIKASGTKAVVERRIPVEAVFTDSDGVFCHILLHVVDGLVNELEVYKDDPSRVIDVLDPSAIRLYDYYGNATEIKRND